MPFFTPLTKASQLPKLASDIERAVMDWKAPGAVGATPFHKAKDVASFANHLGGVLLVGACEGGGGKLGTYQGMTRSDARAVADKFSKADQKCLPLPTIGCEQFDVSPASSWSS